MSESVGIQLKSPNQVRAEATIDYLPEDVIYRIKIMTGSTKIKEVLPSLCAQGRAELVEDILIKYIGYGKDPGTITFFPLDVIPEKCNVFVKDNDDIYVVFIGSLGNEIKKYVVRLQWTGEGYMITLCDKEEYEKYVHLDMKANTKPKRIAIADTAIE